MPGSSPTMERRLLVNRLNSVDLPTLGRATMATTGSGSGPCRDHRSTVGGQNILQTEQAALSVYRSAERQPCSERNFQNGSRHSLSERSTSARDPRTQGLRHSRKPYDG